MYHSQTIVGNGNAEIHLQDYILAAIILYVDFFVMYMLAMMLFSRVWTDTNNCYKDINYYQDRSPKYLRRFFIDPFADKDEVNNNRRNNNEGSAENASGSEFGEETEGDENSEGNEGEEPDHSGTANLI